MSLLTYLPPVPEALLTLLLLVFKTTSVGQQVQHPPWKNYAPTIPSDVQFWRCFM